MTCEHVVLTAMEEWHYAYYVVRKIKMTHKQVSQTTSVSHDYSVFFICDTCIYRSLYSLKNGNASLGCSKIIDTTHIFILFSYGYE